MSTFFPMLYTPENIMPLQKYYCKDVYKRQVVDTVLLITNCFTITIKGVISDLIGVLYFCFHCTYDDRVDRRNNTIFSHG